MSEHRHGAGQDRRPARAEPADVRAEHTGNLQQAVCSAELLNGRTSVAIDHEGTRYVLRATRTGKLILTK
jgi:hemin uptake protein HemP